MATRSTIAYEDQEGKVHQVYCHYDGYISGVGKILQENYNTIQSVKELISYGDISTIGPLIGTAHNFNGSDITETTFYGRDRGDSEVEARIYGSFDDYEMNYQQEEFNYLFTQDGVWSVFVENSMDWFDLEYELNIILGVE